MNRNARTFVAYTRATRPTGRVISRLLEATNYGIREPDYRPDVLVRWGSRKPMPAASILINEERAIKRASDKLYCLEIARRCGSTIPWTRTWDDAVRLCKNYSGIILGRNATGFGGKDIVVYDPFGLSRKGTYLRRPIKQHDFYSIYVEPTREVRIHVVGDHVIRVQGKYLDFPEEANKNPYIRNYAHGYRFRAPKQELNRSRMTQAINTIRELGLDFGAVDMLLFGSGRESMLLEVNTAPSCSPLTARCYAGEIALLVEQRSGGEIRLAPEIMEAEVELPEETDDEERYVL